MNAYAKYFDKNSKYLSFLVNNEKNFKKYNEIWEKIKNSFEKQFIIEPVYNDQYIKAKTHFYNANFYNNKNQ